MTEEKPKTETEKKSEVKEEKITPAKAKPLPKKGEKVIEQPITDKKIKTPVVKTETPTPTEQSQPDNKSLESKIDNKEDKKDTKDKKKKEEPKIPKKDEAIAKGQALHISKKQAMYICKFIKNKPIDTATADLEQVIKLKKVIPFKGEIPHRKGKGIMSGRYPVKASKLFINILKSLKGNVMVNQMELEKTRITLASASWASRPMRTGRRQGKRTNVLLKATEVKPREKKK